MTNQLAIYKDFDGLQRAAIALQKSGYFSDVKSEAQAIVKVMAGQELGLSPFTSMSGIHIIQNKPVLGSNIMATLVKNDPRYDYHVKQCDDRACILEWLEDGRKVGEAGFTIQEAQAAGLTTKDNWKKYTSDMLFARAISRGARRFAPGIFGGAPVYTPDEMGVDTDEDGYIDAESVVTVELPDAQEMVEEIAEPTPKSVTREDAVEKEYDFKSRPYEPDTLRAALATRAKTIGDYDATDRQRNLLAALLSEYYQDDQKRHTVQLWLTGASSTKDMDGAIVKAMLDWLKPTKDDSGAYVIDDTAKTELSHVLTIALMDEGQEELL